MFHASALIDMWNTHHGSATTLLGSSFTIFFAWSPFAALTPDTPPHRLSCQLLLMTRSLHSLAPNGCRDGLWLWCGSPCDARSPPAPPAVTISADRSSPSSIAPSTSLYTALGKVMCLANSTQLSRQSVVWFLSSHVSSRNAPFGRGMFSRTVLCF